MNLLGDKIINCAIQCLSKNCKKETRVKTCKVMLETIDASPIFTTSLMGLKSTKKEQDTVQEGDHHKGQLSRMQCSLVVV